jgi:hypothetical protein
LATVVKVAMRAARPAVARVLAARQPAARASVVPLRVLVVPLRVLVVPLLVLVVPLLVLAARPPVLVVPLPALRARPEAAAQADLAQACARIRRTSRGAAVTRVGRSVRAQSVCKRRWWSTAATAATSWRRVRSR